MVAKTKTASKSCSILLRILWILSITIGLLLIFPIIVLFMLRQSANMGEPTVTISPLSYEVIDLDSTLSCQGSYLRQEESGLWELYVEGSGEVRGAKQGALTSQLMKYQEDVFINQIRNIIPSDRYLSLLRQFILIFNRNLGEHIPLEYREEIAAMSQFCTDDYNKIGTPYERQLNYHAAHDIGHTMQQYMLVGCSSFGVWGENSATNSLVIGRNFDFYMGDDFAANKLLTFAVPDNGYRYASIGWAGMIGVLSGINQCGLTVTINAAKGAIPTSSATPISILTREILQYASNIDEAYQIAKSRKTFVSESILIGSASENKCAIIEKSPEKTALYSPEKELIICTNHFQSSVFKDDSHNIKNIKYSESSYRYDLLSQLLATETPTDYQTSIEILRNRFGKDNTDIGIGNEMTINQSIAHHATVFMPQEHLMWVSTSPWQSGEFVCYDLSAFFLRDSLPKRLHTYDIDADSNFINNEYPLLIEYREGIKTIKDEIKKIKKTNSTYDHLPQSFIDHFLSINPNHYYTYRIVGDYYIAKGEKEIAVEMYSEALKLSIPYLTERLELEELIR